MRVRLCASMGTADKPVCLGADVPHLHESHHAGRHGNVIMSGACPGKLAPAHILMAGGEGIYLLTCQQ